VSQLTCSISKGMFARIRLWQLLYFSTTQQAPMAQSQGPSAPPTRVWLLSIPRSGSHLLTKIFSKQSRLSYSGYNFMDYIFQHHKIMDQNVALDQLSSEDRDALLKTAKDGLAKTKSTINEIEAEVSKNRKGQNSTVYLKKVSFFPNAKPPRAKSPS
jgi:hypothetical protein